MTPDDKWTKVPSVTLVLGAGVSKNLVPDWDELTDKIVEACEADESLKSCNRPPCERLPNDNQVRLELGWRKLHDRLREARQKTSAKKPNIGSRILALEADIEKAWFKKVRAALYPKGEHSYLDARHSGSRSEDPSPSTTLNAITNLLTRGDNKNRVRRVVTFNADDWLEYALVRALEKDSPEQGRTRFHAQFRVVSQPTYGPDSFAAEQPNPNDAAANSQFRIPIVHAHGLLCHPAETIVTTSSYATPNKQGRGPSYDAPNMLVFRDLDYWRMTSNASSFANYVMLNALSTSRCVFIGLSMRDLNLLRWFGFLAAEHSAAWTERWRYHYSEGKGTDPQGQADLWMRRERAHQWLEGCCDDALKKILSYRNIDYVPTEWGTSKKPRSVDVRLCEALEYKSSPNSAHTKSAAPKKRMAKKNKPVRVKRR